MENLSENKKKELHVIDERLLNVAQLVGDLIGRRKKPSFAWLSRILKDENRQPIYKKPTLVNWKYTFDKKGTLTEDNLSNLEKHLFVRREYILKGELPVFHPGYEIHILNVNKNHIDDKSRMLVESFNAHLKQIEELLSANQNTILQLEEKSKKLINLANQDIDNLNNAELKDRIEVLRERIIELFK